MARALTKAAGERHVSPVEDTAGELEVTVLGLTSPLDTGSLFGRGHGVLCRDRSVAVTFVVDQDEFVLLRARVLRGAGDVRVTIKPADVTAVDVRP